MITRWLIRLAFPALGVLLLLISFGISEPEPVASAPESKPEGGDMPAFEGMVPNPIPLEGPEIVFKWQDSDGGWHYADRPPTQGAWNALAIEPSRPGSGASDSPSAQDWRSPYHAPFALSPEKDS
ncbi:DUF4124 domain-containing protein [Marinobacter zhejiangensis]|uniref:DUF4124 domain-containing protein n=1 Tax=Marinobacter zhejiangensis TaxID=488535 RepID=A0A1I4MCH3_9GAMM|nr:DUF4124 domain-containing protein [Marinobacter zhejiangensis]SFM00939.1 hypothetical protein SAMN04487963_0994 [Marinobacter zhejiangensis]